MSREDKGLNLKAQVGRLSAWIFDEERDDTIMRFLKPTADAMGIPVFQTYITTYIADLRHEVKVIPLRGIQGRFSEGLEEQVWRECDEAGTQR